MLPVIAIAGRPNVGKSTLFNRLTHSRDALVSDLAGLTRDRQYGQGQLNEQKFIAIDTKRPRYRGEDFINGESQVAFFRNSREK